jgi:hypothetical protein
MTLTPVNPIGPQPLTPHVPVPFKLPPGFWNFTDPHDFPWYASFELNYTTDLLDHFVWIDIPDYSPDSFFDIYFTLGEEVIVNMSAISASSANPLTIPVDPDGSWPFGIYNITLKQSTVDSAIEGTIWDAPYLPDGWSFEQPQHHEYGELVPQDSAQHRTTEERWFTTYPSNASAFEYFLTVEPEFELTADWNMELYVATDPTAPIRSTVGDYVAGDWPRTLDVPTILDPDWSEDGYILRVIYDGEYAIGLLNHTVDELLGTSIGDPLWYTIFTDEYFGIPTPYPSGGVIYINCSATPDTYYIGINSTVTDLNIYLIDGGIITPFSSLGDGTYELIAFTTTSMITIVIEPGSLAGEILWIWSTIT